MDDFPTDSPDRKSFVQSELAKVGLSLDDPTMKVPGDKPEARKPWPKTEEAFPGDFLIIEGSWPVSKILAKQLTLGDERID